MEKSSTFRLVCQIALVLLCCFIAFGLYGVYSFQALMATNDIYYEEPTQEQIDLINERCLSGITVRGKQETTFRLSNPEDIDFMLTQTGPHTDQNILFLKCDCQFPDIWNDVILYQTSPSIQVSSDRSYVYDAEKYLNAYVTAFRISNQKMILRIHADGDTILQVQKAGTE